MPDALGINREMIENFDESLESCRSCPRLVTYREDVARLRKKAYSNIEYWGRPVPPFRCSSRPRVWVIGLAPGAHGANRTGRMITGDSSGDWLYRAMHEAGLCSSPHSTDRFDGLELLSAEVTTVVKCVPPGNLPTPGERDTCMDHHMTDELKRIHGVPVIIFLGQFAYESWMRWSGAQLSLGNSGSKRKKFPTFRHGLELTLEYPWSCTVLTSYHPSQQNTRTGVLQWEPFLAVFRRAQELAP